MEEGKKILVKGNEWCRIGNWLYIIFSEKDYDKDKDIIIMRNPVHQEVLEQLTKLGVKYEIDESICPDIDYKQDFNLFDLNKLRKQVTIPIDVKETLYREIPDIEERVMVNVRRGDYLSPEMLEKFYVLSKNYIKKIYSKYYNGMKVLVVSDDKQWCVDNLSDIADDVVVHHFDDNLCDLFANSLTKANICSGSSFSMMGAYLNKNEDIVIHHPYFKYKDWYETGEKIVPTYAKREPVTDDMK